MACLLDTDITIYYIDRDPDALRLVNQLALSGIGMSTISMMEVLTGLSAGPQPLVARNRFELLTRSIPIYPFGEAEARRCAAIRRHLHQQGWRVRSRMLDLMIAATAIEHGLTVATNNAADYRHIPNLQIVTP